MLLIFLIFRPSALFSGAPAPYVPAELHQLALYPLALQRAEHAPDEDRGVAVLPGASVECHDFHARLLFPRSLRTDAGERATQGPKDQPVIAPAHPENRL